MMKKTLENKMQIKILVGRLAVASYLSLFLLVLLSGNVSGGSIPYHLIEGGVCQSSIPGLVDVSECNVCVSPEVCAKSCVSEDFCSADTRNNKWSNNNIIIAFNLSLIPSAAFFSFNGHGDFRFSLNGDRIFFDVTNENFYRIYHRERGEYIIQSAFKEIANPPDYLINGRNIFDCSFRGNPNIYLKMMDFTLIFNDNDDDGHIDGFNDCDPNSPDIYFGAPEICGDGIDQDCDGADLVCDESEQGCSDLRALWINEGYGPNSKCCGDDGSDDNFCSLFNNGYSACYNSTWYGDGDGINYSCECGNSGIQGTCDNMEEGCWTNNNQCCGDDGVNDRFCDGSIGNSVGACESGIYKTEADLSEFVCNCITGLGRWSLSGDAGGGKCCGDDEKEYYNTRRTIQNFIGDEIVNQDDSACCDNMSDCVYNGLCYPANDSIAGVYDIDSDNEAEICVSVLSDGSVVGVWDDADRSKELCELLNRTKKTKWMDSNPICERGRCSEFLDAPSGEFCCGDDENEFFLEGIPDVCFKNITGCLYKDEVRRQYKVFEAGSILGDMYCEKDNGTYRWLYRTNLIASELLNIAKNKDEYTLFCDDYKSALNYYDYSLDSFPVSRYFSGIVGDTHLCGNELIGAHRNDPCVNNVCVLRYKMLSKDVVVFGASLNKDIGEFSLPFKATLRCVSDCDNVPEDGEYHSCRMDCSGVYAYYNKKLKSVIYSNYPITSFSSMGLWQRFLVFIRNPFRAIFSYLRSKVNRPSWNQKNVLNLTKKYSRIYFAREGAQRIEGIAESTRKGEFSSITFSCYRGMICDSLNLFSLNKRNFWTYCNYEDSGGKTYVLINKSFSQETKEGLWQDLTARLRPRLSNNIPETEPFVSLDFPSSVREYETVRFKISIDGCTPPPYNYVLQFGDGNSETGTIHGYEAEVTHTYLGDVCNRGVCGILLEVTDSKNNIVRIQKTINLVSAPELAMSPQEALLVVGATKQFYASGGVGPYSWSIVSGPCSINQNGLLHANAFGVCKIRLEDSVGHTVDSGDIRVIETGKCNIRRGNCNLDENCLFKLSDERDAHASLDCSDYFEYSVCCPNVIEKDMAGCEVGLLRLSDVRDAHAGVYSTSQFANPLCIKSSDPRYTLSCHTSNSCSDTEFCIVALSDEDDAHVSDCDSGFGIKICCSIS